LALYHILDGVEEGRRPAPISNDHRISNGESWICKLECKENLSQAVGALLAHALVASADILIIMNGDIDINVAKPPASWGVNDLSPKRTKL
jgi:hypothetical protein